MSSGTFSAVFADAPEGCPVLEDVTGPVARPLARWEDGRGVAALWLRRPHDGVLRFGVAVGLRDAAGTSWVEEADDPWEDAGEELDAMAGEAPALAPFAVFSVELGVSEHRARPHAVVTWGMAHPLVTTVTVAGSGSPGSTAIAGGARVFVAGIWAGEREQKALLRRDGLPLLGLDAAGRVITELRTDRAG
ncbi:hypothetical protein [Patulibacter americanus]|uniref:hypothetical protein n=1 Tax=Patulibacter americanus TaxID=588672 RepID=UPI0003B3BCAF|nr:hypothetical protein [Patulibacter americanus]